MYVLDCTCTDAWKEQRPVCREKKNVYEIWLDVLLTTKLVLYKEKIQRLFKIDIKLTSSCFHSTNSAFIRTFHCFCVFFKYQYWREMKNLTSGENSNFPLKTSSVAYFHDNFCIDLSLVLYIWK